MRLSIGILAWDEEASIGKTIESLLRQTLFTVRDRRVESIEVICLPNGCTDGTAEVARQALRRGQERCPDAGVVTAVHEIETPSKENAWNAFVHEVSDPQADYLMLMDGDVRMYHPDTLRNLVQALEDHPQANMAGARTIKDIALHRTWNPLHAISRGASEIRRTDGGDFAGCLYCARASVLRRFCLPDILVGEDSFIEAMIWTDFFTHLGWQKRIIGAPNASVLFEAYTSPRRVWKSLKRRAVGIAVNSMIYDELWARATPKEDGGQLLLRWIREDPGWGQKLLQRKIRERGRWVLPPGMLTRWLGRLCKLPLHKALWLLPVAIVATLLHAAACFAANRTIRGGKIKHLWFTTQTRFSFAKPGRGSCP